MADETIAIRVKMIGGEAVVTEAKAVSGAVSGVGSSTAKSAKSVSAAKKGYAGFTRLMKYSSIPVLGGLAVETIRSVNAFRDARKVGLQTQAVIKSTGGVANVTAKQIQNLSNTLSLKTGIDDEEVQSASNMLATFTQIRNQVGKNNDIFNQATTATLDLAAATKTDLISASKQLGKALNDPATGLTALRRSGVSFNAEQTTMIQKLFASGKQLKAQKLILAELTKEFAGSARSQHDTVDRLGVAWENLEETLGKALFPVLRDVTNWLTKSINEARKGKGPIEDIKNVFRAFGDEIQRVADNLSALKNIFDSITGSTFEDALRDASDVPGVNLTGQPATSPIHGGGHHGGTSNTGNEPGHGKTSTANSRGRRGGPLHVHVNLRGKQIAEAVFDEAQIAGGLVKSTIRIRYAKKDFEVGLGDGPIQPTDGFGGYQVIDRSRDDGMTQWDGQGPPAYAFPILLDGYPDRGIQREYDRFMALGRSEDGDEAPPVFRVSGPFDGSGKRYVMEGTPDFGQTIRDSRTGRLLRQALTATFRLYVPTDQVKIKRRRSGSNGIGWDERTYTTRKDDTLVAIAARLRPHDSGKEQIKYAKDLGSANDIRDIRRRLDAGRVLRLP